MTDNQTVDLTVALSGIDQTEKTQRLYAIHRAPMELFQLSRNIEIAALF